VTKTVLIVVQSDISARHDCRPAAPAGSTISTISIRMYGVYDKASGEMLAEVALPANREPGRRSPIWPAASKFIVFPVGGGPLVEEMIAVAL